VLQHSGQTRAAGLGAEGHSYGDEVFVRPRSGDKKVDTPIVGFDKGTSRTARYRVSLSVSGRR